jgi:flavin reductase (DIM6/NTAB) family NADH-FMN oxidoreductase RutF/DNA-binding IclR family transcriptional regulator
MAYLASFDSRQLRNVLGTFTTGVTIVTTRDARGIPHGVTANSFSSVSLDPPLVLWSQALTSRSLEAFGDSEHFAVNILADDQIALSKHFAKSQEDKFATVDYTDGLGGVPVLPGTVAHFECVKVAAYPAGDHIIYVGRVERVGHSGRRPLAFAHGRYMVPCAHELGPIALQESNAPIADVGAVRLIADALPSIHQTIPRHTLCLAVWGNHGPTAIRWERGSDEVTEHLRTGLVMSITQTATGRAFAAFMPPEVVRSFVDEDLRMTRIADEDDDEQRKRFEDSIQVTRQYGFSQLLNIEPSHADQPPTNAFSVPIFDQDGNMIMAISAAAPVTADPARTPPATLIEAAKRLSTLVGQLPRQLSHVEQS